MRKPLLGVVLLSFVAASLRGEKVTLPAVASLVGAAPFFSDVRVFNTSYSSSLNVTATYHCFIPLPCTVGVPQVAITLAPRQSKSFNDIVVNTFASPSTGGGVEFDFSGSEDQLVVTSRLYSTAPTPTVGMFIAGVSSSKAHTTSVLTSIRNGGAGEGFRTNAGFYNANDASASVTFQIFDNGAAAGNPVTQNVPGHSGVQLTGIFSFAGIPSLATQGAVIVATATVPIFAYAAVLDNHTTDPIFVAGAPDQPSQPVTPTNATVNVGQGGKFFVDSVSGTSVTTVTVGSSVTWVWQPDLDHGTSSGTCTGGGPGPYGLSPQGYGTSTCTSSGLWGSNIHHAPFSYSYTFTQAGTFPYFCNVHEGAMTGRVVVTAAGASAVPQSGPATR